MVQQIRPALRPRRMSVLGILKRKIAVRVAFYVCFLMFFVMAAGAAYLLRQQSRSLEGQLLERGRMETVIGAKVIGRVLEEAIDNGVFTLQDAFDTNYVLIPGFEPAKYHTRYDAYLDKAILSLQDEFLKDDSIIYAVATDINGYVPTHNTPYQQAITGNQEQDKVGNRTKRLFNDPIGIKTARNTEEGFLQVYHRDTGETMWDISTPVYVKGKHWGGFRIGFSLKKTKQAQQDLMMTLGGIMAAIFLLSLFLIIAAVNKVMRPLGECTRLASELADGRVERKIAMQSQDEIGLLADALERLRVSLKAAMDRLSRK